jgi:hypothetical protein
VSSWRSVLEQLTALDPAELDLADVADPELLEIAPATCTGINKLHALLTRVAATAERWQAHQADGMATMKSWLTGHCRLSGTEAAGVVRAGRRLEELPQLAAAYAEGRVGTAHVQVVTAAVTPARVAAAAEAGIDLATTDRVLTEAALALGPEDTGRAVRR